MKAKVIQTSHIMTQCFRESAAVDKTETIKLLLWVDHCEKIMDRMGTHNFTDLHVKEHCQGNVIVNTAKEGYIIIECTNPFTEELCKNPILSEINHMTNGVSFYWIHSMMEMH